ncbi:hypothetical protein B7R22_06555 [Subtercola boreus]|uniref:Uncharacterized protein n=1 Tax=Subtercola boreus TaxID=120213 RepID=A0A3E0W1B6_9MICO|nr:transcriptional regulator [Subtercola boreus]RFA15605.1 hypothetical protein B7R22_06555 [Subtercola boreus]
MIEQAHVVIDERVFYRDIKPYDAPQELAELHGPSQGQMVLPINVYWGPAHTFDLDNKSDVVEAYQAVLREGRVKDQAEILNSGLLVSVWPQLLLPARVQALWENRFPILAAA